MRKTIVLTICSLFVVFSPVSLSIGQTVTKSSLSDGKAIISPTIASLKQQLDAGNSNAVNEFWKRVQTNGAPIIESMQAVPGHSVVTFVYRGGTELKSVRVDSPVTALLINGIEPNLDRLGMMERLLNTDVWYLSVDVRNDLRTSYTFYPEYSNGLQTDQEAKSRIDPFNPNVFGRDVEGQEVSVIELPGAEAQPWVKENPTGPKGSWDTIKFNSKALGNERTVWVYKPPGYEPKRAKPYGFVVCFGGLEFGKLIPTRAILDNLITAGKIPPTLAILIDGVDPKSEQARYTSTIQFLADELLPQLRKQYNLTAEASKAVIAGTSRRGLVAALIGFERSDIFGGVLSLSGAFYWRPDKNSEYEWLSTQFAAKRTVPLKLYLSAGLLETVITPGNAGHYMLSANRHMRNVLEAKGYKFKLVEYNGGHEDLNWQGKFVDGLIFLLGQ